MKNKEFAKAVLDENVKTFIVHMSSLSLRSKMTIHLAKKDQIAWLLTIKVTVPAEYWDFANVYSKKSAKVLLE